MASGLSKIEKSADMARLQGYVELLERAATAMNALADLEKSGKLEKIANSLRWKNEHNRKKQSLL